jgi:hypothetical protein
MTMNIHAKVISFVALKCVFASLLRWRYVYPGVGFHVHGNPHPIHSVQSITLKVEFITSCLFDKDECPQYSQRFAAVKVKAQKLFAAVMAVCHLASGVVPHTQRHHTAFPVHLHHAKGRLGHITALAAWPQANQVLPK